MRLVYFAMAALLFALHGYTTRQNPATQQGQPSAQARMMLRRPRREGSRAQEALRGRQKTAGGCESFKPASAGSRIGSNTFLDARSSST